MEQLLFAIPRLPAARVREILAACADLKLSYKILPVSFAYLNDRGGRLGALRPLARPPAAAQPGALRRRTSSTGWSAAGASW